MIIQGLILVFTCLSIWFLAGKKNTRLGFVFGLLGQPLWIWTTWQAGQWGMFAVSLWFVFNHCRGLYNYRAKPGSYKTVICRKRPGSINSFYLEEVVNPLSDGEVRNYEQGRKEN